LCGIVLISQPALGPALDFEGIGLRAVGGGYKIVMSLLGLAEPGGALRGVVNSPGRLFSVQHLCRRRRTRKLACRS
jgi:hypothetical protein